MDPRNKCGDDKIAALEGISRQCNRRASLTIRAAASVNASSSTVSATRKWPAPPSPKLSPGMVTTFSSSRSLSQKSRRVKPVRRTSTMMNMPPSGMRATMPGALERPETKALGATAIGLAHHVDFGKMMGERMGRRVLEEGLRAEQHGFRQGQEAVGKFPAKPTAQPQRKPGMACDFDRDETTTVRSRKSADCRRARRRGTPKVRSA